MGSSQSRSQHDLAGVRAALRSFVRVLQPSLDDTASDGSGKLTILLAELDAFLADNKARTAQLARGSTNARGVGYSVGGEADLTNKVAALTETRLQCLVEVLDALHAYVAAIFLDTDPPPVPTAGSRLPPAAAASTATAIAIPLRATPVELRAPLCAAFVRALQQSSLLNEMSESCAADSILVIGQHEHMFVKLWGLLHLTITHTELHAIFDAEPQLLPNMKRTADACVTQLKAIEQLQDAASLQQCRILKSIASHKRAIERLLSQRAPPPPPATATTTATTDADASASTTTTVTQDMPPNPSKPQPTATATSSTQEMAGHHHHSSDNNHTQTTTTTTTTTTTSSTPSEHQHTAGSTATTATTAATSSTISGSGSYVSTMKDYQFSTCTWPRSKMPAPPSIPVMRRLALEFGSLATSLPCSEASSIFVRVHEHNSCLLRVLIIGPDDTPYAFGCFEFEIEVTQQYPLLPPKMVFLTTGNGRVSFNPNLYSSGKVCLSLLGTWSGEPWTVNSTLLQILVSVQSLILCKEPYYNEPARFTHNDLEAPQRYNVKIRGRTFQYAILDQITNYQSSVFHDVIRQHFLLRRDAIVASLASDEAAVSQFQQAMSHLED